MMDEAKRFETENPYATRSQEFLLTDPGQLAIGLTNLAIAFEISRLFEELYKTKKSVEELTKAITALKEGKINVVIQGMGIIKRWWMWLKGGRENA